MLHRRILDYLHQAKEGLNDASKPRQFRFNSCDNEELRDQLRQLSQESQRLMDENHGLQARISYCATRLRNNFFH